MTGLTDDQKLTLLNSYLAILPPRWAAQQNYIAMYFTIVLAVFGFAASQVVSLVKADLGILLSAPLIVASLISWYAKRSIGKQEKHIRELIVVTAKLEHSLGLYEKLETEHKNQPWTDDPHMLPTSWVTSRTEAGVKSILFVNQEIGGTSRIATYLFTMFMIIGIVLAITAILVQWRMFTQSL